MGRIVDSKSRCGRTLAHAVFVWAFWFVLPVWAQPGREPPYAGEDLFEATNILRINISISDEGMARLRGYRWRGGDPENQERRPVVKARVTDGAKAYTDVAIHLKGSVGSFRPVDDRPALTLNFDKFSRGQTFHGLEKISLNNSVQDPSLLTERLCREIFQAAGVPVPRSHWAIVKLNGRVLGLYVLTEGFNKQFLRRHFRDTSGNLYDGGFCRDITDTLAVNSGDNPRDDSDLRRLAAASDASLRNNRVEELASILDLDQFLTFAALEIIQCHWDGYAMNRNNYRLFHNRETDRMLFIPHGMDQMFGTRGQATAQMRIVPSLQGQVARAVLGTEEGRERYIRRVGELRTNVFDVVAVTNRVRELERWIRPVLAQVRPGLLQEHARAVNQLCESIVERGISLDAQLGTPPVTASFGPHGSIDLSGWQPRKNGAVAEFHIVSKGEQKALYIGGKQGAASWRTGVVLPAGRYLFEARVKTRDVRGGGATIRISGSQPGRLLRGNADWTRLSFPIDINEGMKEVELVCELRGGRGDAWWELDSLKLRRHNE